jgi:hypothetical protein
MEVNERRECDLRSEEAVLVKRAGLPKPPMGRLSPRLRLIVTNIAEFFGPANKSSLPAFLLFRGYRFVGDVLDFARCQLFDQRRERAMIFDCRLLCGFLEIGINPKTDLRHLLAFFRHGLPVDTLL